MIIVEPWDHHPDALLCEVALCVVCGRYCTKHDLSATVEWWPHDADRRAAYERHTTSPVLTCHCGECCDLLDRAAHADDGWLLTTHVDEALDHLRRNVTTPPRPGLDGLERRHRVPLDLIRTHRLLTSIGSPLLGSALESCNSNQKGTNQ
jgi:hypothetical protein